MNRVNLIKSRLEQAFSPAFLEIRDDSEHHKGHVGSQGGAGHYHITIAAPTFSGKSRIAVHREIYAVLADLIPEQVHALQIKIL